MHLTIPRFDFARWFLGGIFKFLYAVFMSFVSLITKVREEKDWRGLIILGILWVGSLLAAAPVPALLLGWGALSTPVLVGFVWYVIEKDLVRVGLVHQ